MLWCFCAHDLILQVGMTHAARPCGSRELRHHFNFQKTRYVRNIPLSARVEIAANGLRASLRHRDYGSSANSAAGARDQNHVFRVCSDTGGVMKF
jgi:hypothetical protein